MTTTTRYTLIHNAIASCAERHQIRPFAARVLLAVADRGGQATSYQIGVDLASDYARSQQDPDRRTEVRRSIGTLIAKGLATGEGASGGPRRPGARTLVKLTADGHDAAARMVVAAKGLR